MAYRNAESVGTSSAVASVFYTRGKGNNIEVTKSGSYIFSGDASSFHEWEFRTRLRLKAAGDDDHRYAAQMSRVLDGLRGDAFLNELLSQLSSEMSSNCSEGTADGY